MYIEKLHTQYLLQEHAFFIDEGTLSSLSMSCMQQITVDINIAITAKNMLPRRYFPKFGITLTGGIISDTISSKKKKVPNIAIAERNKNYTFF